MQLNCNCDEIELGFNTNTIANQLLLSTLLISLILCELSLPGATRIVQTKATTMVATDRGGGRINIGDVATGLTEYAF